MPKDKLSACVYNMSHIAQKSADVSLVCTKFCWFCVLTFCFYYLCLIWSGIWSLDFLSFLLQSLWPVRFGLLGYKSPAMTCIVVADLITYVQMSLLAPCLWEIFNLMKLSFHNEMHIIIAYRVLSAEGVSWLFPEALSEDDLGTVISWVTTVLSVGYCKLNWSFIL